LDHDLGPRFGTPPFWTQFGDELFQGLGIDMGPPFGTLIWGVIWDPDLGPRFGTPIKDPDLGPQFGTLI
jgi:hypothetical protein